MMLSLTNSNARSLLRGGGGGGRRRLELVASSVARRAISSAQLTINRQAPDENARLLEKLPPKEELKFGKIFSSHMLEVEYNKAMGGWQAPSIVPFHDLKISPAAAALHYGEPCVSMRCFNGGTCSLCASTIAQIRSGML